MSYEGAIFSDIVSGWGSLTNTECRVYWRSPSADVIYKNPSEVDNDAKCPLIYFGTVRKYNQGMDRVRLTVEDKSQTNFHQDLPLPDSAEETNWLGFDDDVPDRFKGKAYPMVFGGVDKSPCVAKIDTADNFYNIYADKNTSETTIGTVRLL